ncbi:zf-HC2 domain-containing protein [Urbifossiella limnaea]|uniref:Zinc-finger domain-containing protein n=1 Tax=Urbifossiella limnaea TaxID=2528023 RepID=A0A517Y2X9_9BACT|nr:zf-HC2 domain-containing protein [Urbifossiella limnaea]QDU24160.1 hypothetical protein ETAA1_61740 [Urbifossiella limnaea]
MTAKPTDADVSSSTPLPPVAEVSSPTPLPPDVAPISRAIQTTTCDRVQRSLEGYVGGGLSEVERVGLAFHLSLCTTCKIVADEYLEIVRLAGTLRPADPPPDVEARLRKFIGRAIGRPDTGNR